MGKLEGRRELEARREWGAGGREGKKDKAEGQRGIGLKEEKIWLELEGGRGWRD